MTWRAAAVEHAMAEMPREACGLLVLDNGQERYFPCRNLAQHLDEFMLDPADYAAADLVGEIVAVVHSHPNAQALPSDADMQSCNASGLPWFIVSVPTVQWARLEPNTGIIEA